MWRGLHSAGDACCLLRNVASSQRLANDAMKIVYPAGSCHRPIDSIPPVVALQLRKNVRQRLNVNAQPAPQTRSTARRAAFNRKNSPKKADAMSVPASDRMPLHASSTPTEPVATSITLPLCSAGILKRFKNSTVTEVTADVSFCKTACSIASGHGNAKKMSKNGPTKWRTHRRPPTAPTSARLKATTMAAWSQLSGRQSGFDSSTALIGSNNNSPTTPLLISAIRGRSKFGSGLVDQRRPKRYAIKKGTKYPNSYCGFVDQSFASLTTTVPQTIAIANANSENRSQSRCSTQQSITGEF